MKRTAKHGRSQTKPLFATAVLTLAAIALALPGNATGPENTIATPDMIAAFERGPADQ